MRAWIAAVLVLAGCDKLLGLQNVPEAFAPASASATLAAGAGHTCWIDSHGALWCWGNDGDGQLGDGGTGHQFVPVPVGAGYAAVATGRYHTCAIRSDGALECWGYNGHGQLGDGTTQQRATPGPIGTEAWSSIALGNTHSCGITQAGHLRCWGRSDVGQLGNPMIGDVQSPAPVLVNGADRTDWIGVAANADHTCAWTASREAYCFGDSSHGEL